MCTYFCMRFIYSQSGIQGPCWGGWDCALLPGQMAPVTEGGGGEGAIKGKRGKKGGLEWPLNGAGVACPPEPPHLETTCRRISFTHSVFPDGGVAALVAGRCLARHCAHFSVTLVSLHYGRRKRRCRKSGWEEKEGGSDCAFKTNAIF